jgi:hypothetical protein
MGSQRQALQRALRALPRRVVHPAQPRKFARYSGLVRGQYLATSPKAAPIPGVREHMAAIRAGGRTPQPGWLSGTQYRIQRAGAKARAARTKR